MIVHVAIGNSDDMLTQAEWSAFLCEADLAFNRAARYEGSQQNTTPWLQVRSDVIPVRADEIDSPKEAE